MTRHPAALAALALLAAGPALAQSTAGEARPGLTGAVQAAQGGGFLTDDNTMLRASKVRGIPVIGQDHHTLGSIDDLLIGRDGRIEAVVIGSGGVLGMGGRKVAVPYDRFLWNTEGAARVGTPAATATPGTIPDPGPGRSAERSPGAGISNEVLTAESRSGEPRAETGPVVTGSTERATVPVAEGGDVRRAMLRMTKAELDAAPEFRPEGSR